MTQSKLDEASDPDDDPLAWYFFAPATQRARSSLPVPIEFRIWGGWLPRCLRVALVEEDRHYVEACRSMRRGSGMMSSSARLVDAGSDAAASGAGQGSVHASVVDDGAEARPSPSASTTAL